jgi:hypothetical protein
MSHLSRCPSTPPHHPNYTPQRRYDTSPNNINKAAQQCHVTATQQRRQSSPTLPCHSRPTTPTNPLNDATSQLGSELNTVEGCRAKGNGGSMAKGNGRGREDVQEDNEAMCIPHAASFPFFFVDRAVCTLHAALFSFVLSPRRFPSCGIDEAACLPHAVLFSLFFSSTGRCAPCTPPCFYSFILPGGPPPRRSTRQRASHTLPRYLSFFSLMGVEPAPILIHLPPCWGNPFYFHGVIVNGGRV